MPLQHSKSPAAFKSNVRTLMHEVGESPHVQSPKQALAIAYETQRRAGKKHARGGRARKEDVFEKKERENSPRGYRGYLITPSIHGHHVSKDGYHITTQPSLEEAQKQVDMLTESKGGEVGKAQADAKVLAEQTEAAAALAAHRRTELLSTAQAQQAESQTLRDTAARLHAEAKTLRDGLKAEKDALDAAKQEAEAQKEVLRDKIKRLTEAIARGG